jgi:hypothetical protein
VRADKISLDHRLSIAKDGALGLGRGLKGNLIEIGDYLKTGARF